MGDQFSRLNLFFQRRERSAMIPEKLSLNDANGENRAEFNGTKSTHQNLTFLPTTCSTTHEDCRAAPMKKQSSNTSRSPECVWTSRADVSTGDSEPEVDVANQAGQEAEGNAGHTVCWDENDPMNPRNMSKARRWLIVIIVSTGSICVLVNV